MDIPKASDFQPQAKVEDPAIYQKWHELAISVLSDFIQRNEPAFRAGLDAKFEFPTFRDTGEAERMWIRHYQKIIKELQDSGWVIRLKIPMGESPVIFISSVPDEGNRKGWEEIRAAHSGKHE